MSDTEPPETRAVIEVAALRAALRAFLAESDRMARASGLTPQRHLSVAGDLRDGALRRRDGGLLFSSIAIDRREDDRATHEAREAVAREHASAPR
jgi:hypothetical protein